MEKIELKLSIIKTENDYRALIQIGENLLTNKEVIYKSSREIENSLIDIRVISEELREEARKWARRHNIRYVINLDLSPSNNYNKSSHNA